ncbi:unnamed protein product [Lupinus luteus]|uniref:25S rRNA (uridine-N(3))-methyltransferase BMT5-like domain-containing protein n=1 Tax=Lupinus luteus TaxID=3873 RepID=A0AAV1XQF6_LUPLU
MATHYEVVFVHPNIRPLEVVFTKYNIQSFCPRRRLQYRSRLQPSQQIHVRLSHLPEPTSTIMSSCPKTTSNRSTTVAIETPFICDTMKEKCTINYNNSLDKILLVGEGDFSFALSLARKFGSAKNMFATSLDSRGSIRI